MDELVGCLVGILVAGLAAAVAPFLPDREEFLDAGALAVLARVPEAQATYFERTGAYLACGTSARTGRPQGPACGVPLDLPEFEGWVEVSAPGERPAYMAFVVSHGRWYSVTPERPPLRIAEMSP